MIIKIKEIDKKTESKYRDSNSSKKEVERLRQNMNKENQKGKKVNIRL